MSSIDKEVFVSSEQYRSDSDNGRYIAAVEIALSSPEVFENFKRMRGYTKVLEHVSEEHGNQYLDLLLSRRDGLLENALDSVLLSDSVGNPRKYHYRGLSIPLSPTTLRYIKVASDLKILFGESIQHVAEIGCGYGGQCLVNDQLLGFRYATLFDLPPVNLLIEKYLEHHVLGGAYEVATINKKLPQSYDLIVSNYAFSELPAEVQGIYIEKVLKQSARGYLTMNTGLRGRRSRGKLRLRELEQLLPDFSLLEEEPSTHRNNYILVWGQDAGVVEEFFRPLIRK